MAKHMNWTKEKIDELRKLKEQEGCTHIQTAEEMGLNFQQIEWAVKYYKIKSPHFRIWTTEKVNKLRELIKKKGYSMRQAAGEMGLSLRQIRGAATSYGIKSSWKRSDMGAQIKERTARIKELLIAGHTHHEIAIIISKELGKEVKTHTLKSFIHRYRLTKNFLSRDIKIATYQALTLPVDNYLITCDYHSPCHSEVWVNRSLAIADKFKIKKHIIIGDLFDFNALKFWATDDGGTIKDLDKEISQTDPVIKALDYFDENILVCGNHERRVGMKTDSMIQARHLFGLYGAGIWDKKFKYSVYDKLFIGDEWMVVHPRSYSQISTSVAKKLAEKYHKNIINSHGHFVGMTYDRSGKFLAIDLGGMFDVKKVDYINLQTTTHPQWRDGFGMLYNGHFYHFTDETDWSWWL